MSKIQLVVVIFIACYVAVDSNAASLEIQADVNDYKAARSPIRSLNVTIFSVSDLQKNVGPLQDHQVVSIWCIGQGMGAGDISAFDVLQGNQIASSLKKMGATPKTTLVQLCRINQADFEKRQRR